MKATSRFTRRFAVVTTAVVALSASMTMPALADVKPVAVADSYTLAAGDQNVLLDVLANDESPSDAPLAISYIETFQPGVQLTVDGNNVYASVASDATYGSRAFDYTVSDGVQESDYGAITVTVPDSSGGEPPPPPPPPPAASPPVARDDHFAPRGKGTFTYDVLANDYDPQGRPLVVSDWYAASSGGYNGYYKISLSRGVFTVHSEAYLKDNLVVHYTVSNGTYAAPATAVLPFAGVCQLKFNKLSKPKPRRNKPGKVAISNCGLNSVQYIIREDYGGRFRKLVGGVIRPQSRVVVPIRLKRHVKGRPAVDVTSYLLVPGARRQTMDSNRLRF